MSVVLGLETSCDETSAALVDEDDRILGHVILSQDIHHVFGGVVPELAARAHLVKVDSVVDEALEQAGLTLSQVDAIAVTVGPGLIGALLVGVSWAKAVGWALGKPVVPVHHMEAHLFGPVLEDDRAKPPFIGLLVSGGHTLLVHARAWGQYELLGETRDDAAGEAFDKVAKLLGLPYPGGPAVEELAESGTASHFALPRPMLRSNQRPSESDFYDFSFSGLKTATAHLARELDAMGVLDVRRPDVAAAFQDAVIDTLVSKTHRAVVETGCSRVIMGGGVSANEALFREMKSRLGSDSELYRASTRLSLDNGAMVARAGRFRWTRGEIAGPELEADAKLAFPGLVRRSSPDLVLTTT